jgi:SiaC family regulatory phosphoprotein
MAISPLIIDQTKKTPGIKLESGRIVITGRSISENPGEFYRPIHEWMIRYVADGARTTDVQLAFEFINTTSIKWIYAILKEMNRIPDLNQHVRISWYYEVGDEDMLDLGFILRSLVSCPFKIVEVDDIDKQNFEL